MVELLRTRGAGALIGLDVSWRAKAVSIACHDPPSAGDEAFSPIPAIAARQLVRIVSRGGHQGDPALIALLSWVSLLRGQAECRPVARQRAGEDLANGQRLRRQALLSFSKGI